MSESLPRFPCQIWRLLAVVAALVVCPLATNAEPVIAEFMAANDSTLADEDGAYSDWVEIYNPDGAPVSLLGWYLTDNAGRKSKWALPELTLPAQGRLIVFASGKNRRDPARPLHTNFSLDADGEYLALVRPDGDSAATEFAPEYPSQYPDVSYGAVQAGPSTTMGYLRRPTPGMANSDAGAPLTAARAEFSQPSGPFSEPFLLSLSGADAGQRIRYVAVPVSGRGLEEVPEPTAQSPEYTGPLMIQDSVVIRAAIFSADDRARGPSAVVHYLRLAAAGTGRADLFASALPIVLLGVHGSGNLDPNGTTYGGWVHVFEPDLAGRPAFSAVPTVSTPATLRVRGNGSSLFPKKGYSLNLQDADGADNRESLLDLPASDEWALVSPWLYDLTYVRNAFIYTLADSLGQWAPRTRFVETFFDGDGTLQASDYAGISLLTERIDVERLGLAKLSENDLSGESVTGGYILKIDSVDRDEWGFLTDRGLPNLDSAAVVVVSPKAAKLAPAQRDYIRNYVQQMEDALFAGQASGWRDRSYRDYIDVGSWVDHHLLQVFSGNIDALAHSDYFHKDRGGKLAAGPLWDFDRALGSYDPRTRSPETWNAGPVEVWDYGWYGVIATDPEFMQAWIDRWHLLRQRELSTAALTALADRLAAEVTPEAAARDAARWPDNVSPTGRGFSGEISRLKDWLTRRSAWIDQQFVAAPSIVEQGGNVTFTAPAGAVLLYTLDGSDPRALGGEIAPNAQRAVGALTLPAGSNVHVRSYSAEMKEAFPGSPWSAAVGGAASSPLLPASRLVNIATRGTVGLGEDALIAGVVIADTMKKTYLARAVGPGLAAFGAAGTVGDPQLSVFNSSGVEILRNNGWQNGPSAGELPRYSRSVGAFPLAAGSADSALAVELGRGVYTVQVTTPSGQRGIGLAELYELDANGRTANLSTRARVGTGEDVLIGGFVVQGSAYKRMLIRAIGPTLAGFGVANALEDPELTIYRGQAVFAANDRWTSVNGGETVAAAGKMVGAFPLAGISEDAALLITLPPGAYTVEVKGKNGGQGVALLEIYELP